MQATWRWFGPQDIVTLEDIAQAGASGIVTALHHIPTGAVWSLVEIRQRQQEISVFADGRPSCLHWSVVESLPVSEDIKKRSGDWRAHIDNYIESIGHIAAAGISVICYNFMPILDWTRTDLAWRLPNGASCMRFDLVDFALFDLFILARKDAASDTPEEIQKQAAARYAKMSEADCAQLANTIIAGLPGAADGYSLASLQDQLNDYAGITAEKLRENLFSFLQEVIPAAEELGLRLCCHPDDPPFPLLGLPRILSTEADYEALLQAVDSPANGITLCSGSLGVRPDNDLTRMMRQLGGRVHFLHLRNVKREAETIPASFYEAEHLGGDTDMVALIEAVLEEEARRQAAGRSDSSLPFRPDHGQDILDDLGRRTQPGYPSIGRLKGLAELRGVIAALTPRIAV